MNERPDKSIWEEQINALLDGELTEEQAELLRETAAADPVLDRAITEAVELHKLMLEIPFEHAPGRLRRKLRQIPRQQSGNERSGFLQLRWGMAMATILIAVAITVTQLGSTEPTDVEIAQARQDFNLVLAYVARASRKTRYEIASNIGHGFARPVTKNTVRLISDQFRFNEE